MNDGRRVSIRTAALSQFELLLRLMYPLALVVLLMIGTLGFYHSLSDSYHDLPPWRNRPGAPWLVMYLAIMGILAGLLTWFNESPRRRRYHYSLPVGHVTHNVLRLLAGAGWLMVAVIVLCLAIPFVEDPLMFREWLLHAPVFWFALFAIPLLTYLLTSIFAVAFEWAVVWILGIITLLLMLDLEPVQSVLPELVDVKDAIVAYEAPRSLTYAIFGFEERVPWIGGKSQSLRVFNSSAQEFYARNPSREYVSTLEVERATILKWSGRKFEPKRNWFAALMTWYVLAICGVALALRRRAGV